MTEDISSLKVSVIIPTYNRPLLLKRSIDSVLAQTFQDFEIIIIDSSKDDATNDLVGSYHDQRLKYMHDQKVDGWRGVSHGRNIGIGASRGVFIAFLDDDDEWLPKKLEMQLEKFNDPSVGLVYCDYNLVSDEIIVRTVGPRFNGNVYSEALRACFVLPSLAIVRRDTLDSSGLFDESLEYVEDWDMWIRVASISNFDYVPIPLVNFRCHDDEQTMNKKLKVIYAKRKIVEANKGKMNKTTLAKHYHWLGANYLLVGKVFGAFHYEVKALTLDPKAIIADFISARKASSL